VTNNIDSALFVDALSYRTDSTVLYRKHWQAGTVRTSGPVARWGWVTWERERGSSRLREGEWTMFLFETDERKCKRRGFGSVAWIVQAQRVLSYYEDHGGARDNLHHPHARRSARRSRPVQVCSTRGALVLQGKRGRGVATNVSVDRSGLNLVVTRRDIPMQSNRLSSPGFCYQGVCVVRERLMENWHWRTR